MTDETAVESFENGAYMVSLSRFGVYNAHDKDGKCICTSGTKDDAIFWARNHLFGPLPGVSTYVTNVKLGTPDALK